MSEGGWVPINDYPGDQMFDNVPGTPLVSHWGEIGTDSPSGWSWVIMATDDDGQWEAAAGHVGTEAEAKAAVEKWKPRNA